MVERTHQDLLRVLSHQQQQVLRVEPPSIRLAKALFTINFLNCSFEDLNPPVARNFGGTDQLALKAKPPVLIKDPETGQMEGPYDLVTWGCGYACISTPTGPRWIPAKWVRPYTPKPSGKGVRQVRTASWRRRRREEAEEEEIPQIIPPWLFLNTILFLSFR